MSGSVNKVILLGNLGRDPEVRMTQSSTKIVNLNVATNESWKDRDSGQTRSQTEWHRVVIFGPVADVAERYLRKGSTVYLEGQLRTRKWQDQSGQDKYTTEIVVSGFRGQLVLIGGNGNGAADRGDSRSGGREEAGGYGSYGGREEAGGYGGRNFDDEIPF